MISASFVSCLCEELNRELTGGRIDKIQQPAKDVVLLTVRSNGANRRLLISASPGKARIHLTQTAYENPAEPPLFCILLRKHLTGALIEGFEQPGQDRLLVMNLVCFDDLGRETKERLITEMIPGRTNIVLVGEDGLIVDCAYRRDYEADMYRRLSPGMVYRLPPKPEGCTSIVVLVPPFSSVKAIFIRFLSIYYKPPVHRRIVSLAIQHPLKLLRRLHGLVILLLGYFPRLKKLFHLLLCVPGKHALKLLEALYHVLKSVHWHFRGRGSKLIEEAHASPSFFAGKEMDAKRRSNSSLVTYSPMSIGFSAGAGGRLS